MLTFPFDDLADMLNSDEYDAFISDRLGNQLAIDDPERYERVYEAAQDGADGSTHAEAIQDMRDFFASIDDPKPDTDGEEYDTTTESDAIAEYDRQEREIEAWRDRIDAEINACEQRHEEAGTLHDQIG